MCVLDFRSPRMDPRETVVGLGGLEPPASPLSGVRSNHLSYRPLLACLLTRSLRFACRSLSHVPEVRSLVRSGANLALPPKSCAINLTGSAGLVELIGIEPTTPCLQSRCSPS